VLLNLLSNAIKFTPRNGTTTVTLRHEGDGLAIAVADTGIGIAPENVARAFEPFRQVDNRLARKYEGTGLGLPLSQRLMALHGGTLTIDSAVDRGTTVTMHFPSTRVVVLEAAVAA
jgi:signal transduction histidine kinase